MTKKKKNIIFIFSLPRSGSTMLQKALASHSKISTFAEPWLLLPLLSLDEAVSGKYFNHDRAGEAVKDLINNLPKGKSDYFTEVNKFVSSIYEKYLSEDEIYFIDKTPNYYHIIDKIEAAFPDAKFVFLFRNPLSILASVMNTWYRGKFMTSKFLIRDLSAAPEFIADNYERMKEKSVKIVYDEFVTNPEKELKRIFDYLELDFEKEVLDKFPSLELGGTYNWEKIGNAAYQGVSSKPKDKWKETFTSSYKKRFAKEFIAQTDDLFLQNCGIKKNELLTEIEKIKTDSVGIIDFFDHKISYGVLKNIDQKTRDKYKKKLAPALRKLGLKKTADNYDG
ncbi:MAG: sulfotransferase [Chlorobi bacterium]|nr:sulfotransferase [Chlorobiota bacterium]